MSVVDKDGNKVVLPRVGPEEFWDLVRDNYAHDDTQKWKTLAILALRENAGWPLEVIAQVFGHHRGHILRLLTQVKRELQARFDRSPEWLDMHDPDAIDESESASAISRNPGRAEQAAGFSSPQRR